LTAKAEIAADDQSIGFRKKYGIGRFSSLTKSPKSRTILPRLPLRECPMTNVQAPKELPIFKSQVGAFGLAGIGVQVGRTMQFKLEPASLNDIKSAPL
jgi:hypothetical protein